jgi:hypothetical protein
VWIRAGILVVVLCASADVAVAGRWTVNEGGNCVQEWTPSSMARGPRAMTNALTLPGRQLVGGGQAAYGESSRSTGERILLVPTLALIGLGSGTTECLFVMSQGLADFITGGAFDLVSDESADLSLAPMTPRFLQGLKQAPPTDPCGRPR